MDMEVTNRPIREQKNQVRRRNMCYGPLAGLLADAGRARNAS